MSKFQKKRKKAKNEEITSIPEEAKEKILSFDQNETAKRMTKRPQ